MATLAVHLQSRMGGENGDKVCGCYVVPFHALQLLPFRFTLLKKIKNHSRCISKSIMILYVNIGLKIGLPLI